MIRVENLTKAFDGNVVLDRLCLDVREGETVVVIGSSTLSAFSGRIRVACW